MFAEAIHVFYRPSGTQTFFCALFPSDKSLGYFQKSLRDNVLLNDVKRRICVVQQGRQPPVESTSRLTPAARRRIRPFLWFPSSGLETRKSRGTGVSPVREKTVCSQHRRDGCASRNFFSAAIWLKCYYLRIFCSTSEARFARMSV